MQLGKFDQTHSLRAMSFDSGIQKAWLHKAAPPSLAVNVKSNVKKCQLIQGRRESWFGKDNGFNRSLTVQSEYCAYGVHKDCYNEPNKTRRSPPEGDGSMQYRLR